MIEAIFFIFIIAYCVLCVLFIYKRNLQFEKNVIFDSLKIYLQFTLIELPTAMINKMRNFRNKHIN